MPALNTSARGASGTSIPWPTRRAAWIGALLVASATAQGEPVGCVTTSWKLIGANHKVCVEAFGDPRIPGVTCHVSQARTGGISGGLGLAEDPGQFALSCRQTGPIRIPPGLPKDETVFAEGTSLLFKETRVVRLWDAPHNSLVYLAISRKLIDGAPANSLSTVPVAPWTTR
ncbi:MAG: CreA family protein [Methylotetracoccus sp.]